jgi:hypothetical protein
MTQVSILKVPLFQAIENFTLGEKAEFRQKFGNNSAKIRRKFSENSAIIALWHYANEFRLQ